MKAATYLCVVWVLFGALSVSRATIEGDSRISVDFSNPDDATNKTTWSTPDRLNVSKQGLGFDAEAPELREGWIQTKPLAIGWSWRPTSFALVRATLQPPPREITLPNGQKTTPYPGDMFVRYSPDLKHWSSWQALQANIPQAGEEQKISGRRFAGMIHVPERDSRRYHDLLHEYSQLDVPWKSDEEAAVQWILEKQPDFFAKQIPFIGYVEFLYEGSFYGGQRIRSFNAEVLYNVNGFHSLPKAGVNANERESIPWRFVAKPGDESPADLAEKCLKDFESITNGMTRAQVESKLNPDGGMRTASSALYVHPTCPYFKIKVEFDFKRNPADQNRAVESKDDRVIRVSKPYLERPFID